MSRTDLTRLPEKASSDRGALDALLDAALLGHVALVRDGRPLVVPTAIARDGDRVLLHGSTGSAWMRAVADGAEICLEITSLDALVVARSAFESSMRYRSAVLFGRCTRLEGEEKERALDVLTDHLIPGRAGEVRGSTGKELAATLVLALPIAEWSLKVSDGWPEDASPDLAGDAWAGVVTRAVTWGPALPAPDLRDGIPMPASVARLVAETRGGDRAD